MTRVISRLWWMDSYKSMNREQLAAEAQRLAQFPDYDRQRRLAYLANELALKGDR